MISTFVIGAGLRGAVTRVWEKPEAIDQTFKTLEFKEGFQAYGDGIDGYAATPYPDGTQQMTDWFAGWVAAKNTDLAGSAP